MSFALESSSNGRRTVLFGLVTAFCLAVTGWAIRDGQALGTVLLFGALTLYALGNALPPVQRRIPRFDRLAGVVLGVVGAVAYATGVPTDLPIFFVLLGVGCLVDLLWDPTGTVYGDDSG